MWTISVDTGGTFTDGIALSPEGKTFHLKVLSTGSLRGKVLKKLNNRCFTIDAHWKLDAGLLTGYFLRFLRSGTEAKILAYNKQDNELQIDRELHFEIQDIFEITANEEAPILLARLFTETLLQESLPPIAFKIGTTKGTNALLEREGARTLFIATKGFGDITRIGTQARPHLFQLDIDPPTIFFSDCLELEERILADGQVEKELENSEIQKICQAIESIDPESVAISLCNAYINDTHEQILAREIRQRFTIPVSVSSSLAPLMKYLYRSRTAIIDAYLSPIFLSFISNIKTKAEAAEIDLMKSDGTLASANTFYAKDSLLSGPSGGLMGAQKIALKYNIEKLISFDMGGTSTDVGRFDQNRDLSFQNEIAGVELLIPMLDIETVAAGGGSICDVHQGGLTVGPASAGANPGPACYGAGGPLTITDLHYLLGRLSEKNLRIPLNRKTAILAFNEIREKLGFSEEKNIELLQGYLRLASEKMAAAIRKISLKKGFDPREYSLVAFGGAGGLHACQLADQLNITSLLIPFEAGILSASGIHHSKKEKLVQRQLLKPLSELQSKLDNIIQEMLDEGINVLIEEGIDESSIQIREIRLYLRIPGQEHSIELFYHPEMELIPSYLEAYNNIFGYRPINVELEIESIRVLVSELEDIIEPGDFPKVNNKPKPDFFQNVLLELDQNYPGYFWQRLKEGDCISGPALIVHDHASLFLEKSWNLLVSKDKDLLLNKSGNPKIKVKDFEQESINLELYKHRFQAIAEGMGAQLQRTAMSINIRERLDFSCAILNENAELVVNAPHIPVHLGCLGLCARLILENYPLEKGDILLTNHPAFGGSHLPDLTLLAGVFDSNNQLVGYVMNRAHHAEIGGKAAGSMPVDATCLAEEGVVILPFYIAKSGSYHWNELKQILQDAPYPSRRIEENLADLHSAVASLKYGADQLLKLIRLKSRKSIVKYMAAIIARGETIIKKWIRRNHGFSSQCSEFLDDGSEIRLSINISKESMVIDFSGSSEVHSGNLNANKAIVYSAVMYVLRLLVNEDIPLNDGLMRNVQIKLEDSMLSPNFPEDPEECPAVAGGNTELSQRVVDTLIKCFSLSACSQGTMNNFLFGNERCSYYETIGGGAGAGPGFHGRSGVHQHMTNTRITDPEDLEHRFPVILREFSIRKNSGGDGKFKGGDGLVRKIEFLEEMEITILSQHRLEAPYGCKGAENGQTGKQFIQSKAGEMISLKGMDYRRVKKGDSIHIYTPGGGGFGTK